MVRRLYTEPLIERVLRLIECRRITCNECALSRIEPVRTVRSQRNITYIRLRAMERELSGGAR